MKLCWLAVLLLLAATLSAIAKRRGQTSMTALFEAGKEASKPRQPGPEMQKLFDAFLGHGRSQNRLSRAKRCRTGRVGGRDHLSDRSRRSLNNRGDSFERIQRRSFWLGCEIVG